MKKLNNKGITSIELLISFIIVTAITVSLFDVVTSYKTKQQIESYKNTITEYKSSVTKVIYDDVLKYHLAVISDSAQQNYEDRTEYKVTLYFDKNLINKSSCTGNYQATGCYKTLRVVKYKESTDTIGEKIDHIIYPEVASGVMRDQIFLLPDIGGAFDEDSEHMLKDIRFSSVSFRNIIDNAVLDIAIFHHELSTYYHIRIVAPTNYYNLVPDSFPKNPI